MRERSARLWSKVLAVTAGGVISVLWPAHGAAQWAAAAPPGKSVTSSIKEGFDKVTGAIVPKKTPAEAEPANDAVSLKNKSKPGAGLYVSMAQMLEHSGKYAEAEQHYQAALKEKPDDLAALVGYAHLKEVTGKPDDAVKLYQQAAKAHPDVAAVFNNLGLCYARNDKLSEAVTALSRAVSLQPKNPLYRNNIATVLVEMGRMQEAFSHLRGVHGDAAAYYNLGYLLVKKGKKQEAAQHFALALRLDPSLAQAKVWLAHLEGRPTRTAVATRPQPVEQPPPGPVLTSNQPAPVAPQIVPNPCVPNIRREEAKVLPPLPRAADEPAGRVRGGPPSEAPPMPPELSMPMRLPPTQ